MSTAYELSMPFARISKKVVESTAEIIQETVQGTIQSEPVKNVASQTSKFFKQLFKFTIKHKFIVIIISISLIGFWVFFKYIQTSGPTPEEMNEIMMAEMAKNLPPEDPIQVGNQAYIMFKTSLDIRQRISSFGKALYHYEQALQTSTGDMYGVLSYRLAKLYHEGVPEGVDRRGEEIEGIPPDANQAIQNYRNAIQSGFHSSILDLASIYHWGLPGFESNRNKAKHLYGVMIKVGTSYEQTLARDRLRQMQEEEGTIIGNGIQPSGGNVADGFSSNVFSTTPFNEEFMTLGESPQNVGKDDLTKGIDDKLVQDLMINDLHIENNRSPDDQVDDEFIPNDPHNARDHMVNTTARQALEKLRANTHIQYDIPTTLKMIHEFILQESDLANSKKKNAISVLQHMAKNINKADFENAKKLEALQLVWNRIQTNHQNKRQQRNLMNNLISELGDCIEYGELVCGVGIINRIVDTLNFIDPVVRIKPKWAIRKEMTMKAEKIRENLLKQCNGMTRDALDSMNPTPLQKRAIKTFLQKLKREMFRNFHKDYVDNGIMSKELLEAELKQWF